MRHRWILVYRNGELWRTIHWSFRDCETSRIQRCFPTRSLLLGFWLEESLGLWRKFFYLQALVLPWQHPPRIELGQAKAYATQMPPCPPELPTPLPLRCAMCSSGSFIKKGYGIKIPFTCMDGVSQLRAAITMLPLGVF